MMMVALLVIWTALTFFIGMLAGSYLAFPKD